jgi:hypothetical protein
MWKIQFLRNWCQLIPKNNLKISLWIFSTFVSKKFACLHACNLCWGKPNNVKNYLNLTPYEGYMGVQSSWMDEILTSKLDQKLAHMDWKSEIQNEK